VPRIHLHDELSHCLGTHALGDIKVSIPAVAHGYHPHLAAFRLDWKVLAGVCHSETILYSLSPSSFLLRLKALPSFGAHLLGPLLVSPAILLCPMPPLQGLRHILSAFRALPTSLSRSRRSVLVFAPFVLCTLTMFVVVLRHGQHLANRLVTSEEQ
jgi:hypothetical protein